MSKVWWRWLLFVGLSLAFLGAALVLRTVRNGPEPALPPMVKVISATLVNDTQRLPGFSLVRAGPLLTNADLQGHWTLMFFGYTYCPDFCPTSLAAVKEMRNRLQAAGVVSPEVVFVSVDPARDTPEHLALFAQLFDPAFIGATGDDAALAPLVKNLGVHYQRQDTQDKKHYTVDHSEAIYLIDPHGRLKAVFSWPHDPAAMAADYSKIISAGG
ncbi:MAG: SCO family protein [Pseudomonadota bacterium]